MAISKGLTICKTERDLILQGFKEQLQILADSQNGQENLLKARLYDIIKDSSLPDEEKQTLKRPYLSQLEELMGYHIRIRRSLFIGLYSFWEVSLMDIVNTHIPTVVEAARISKKSTNFGASDYLKLIYTDKLPSPVSLIDNNIREFRNYMAHGVIKEKQEQLLNDLATAHPEFGIKAICKDYFISEYKGLFEFLSLLYRELDRAENQILKIKHSK